MRPAVVESAARDQILPERHAQHPARHRVHGEVHAGDDAIRADARRLSLKLLEEGCCGGDWGSGGGHRVTRLQPDKTSQHVGDGISLRGVA